MLLLQMMEAAKIHTWSRYHDNIGARPIDPSMRLSSVELCVCNASEEKKALVRNISTIIMIQINYHRPLVM